MSHVAGARLFASFVVWRLCIDGFYSWAQARMQWLLRPTAVAVLHLWEGVGRKVAHKIGLD